MRKAQKTPDTTTVGSCQEPSPAAHLRFQRADMARRGGPPSPLPLDGSRYRAAWQESWAWGVAVTMSFEQWTARTRLYTDGGRWDAGRVGPAAGAATGLAREARPWTTPLR